MEFAVKGKVMEVIEGDIAQVPADAIVNAANNHLWMGAGVAGALKRAGGEEIEREAVSKGPIPVGEAVVTGAGRLPARYVIHAAAMGQDLTPSAETIRNATLNALRRAEELGVQSISLPALGTGVGGFPLEESAKIMVGVVKDFLPQAQHLKRVIFVLYGQESFSVFLRVVSGE